MSKEEVTGEGSGEPPRTKRDCVEPREVPLFNSKELRTWSFYRAVIDEFVTALLYLYVTIATIIGYVALGLNTTDPCDGVGVLGIAWSFGGMIFLLVYCTAGISGAFAGAIYHRCVSRTTATEPLHIHRLDQWLDRVCDNLPESDSGNA